MRQMNYETTDADLSRILEAIESDIETKMATVGTSTDMYQRASVHTHCDHLRRIADEIRAKLQA